MKICVAFQSLAFCLFYCFSSVGYSQQISLIGPATPSQNWDVDYNMSEQSPGIWKIQIYLSANNCKFREDGMWANNWGGNNFPVGEAIPSGQDITVSLPGLYLVTLDLNGIPSYNFQIVTGNVGIGTVWPDESAVLDVFADNKGILVPWMSSIQRADIANPANGLLVYDSDFASFWFYDGNKWNDLSGISDKIQDSDGDTKILTEKNEDENLIRFELGGTEHFVMDGPRIKIRNSGRSIFIGDGVGENSNLGNHLNVAVGDSSLYSLVNGQRNTAIGARALHFSGNGFDNTAIGTNALYKNTSGSSNTAVGVSALFNSQNGFLNTATGGNALYSNTNGGNNTANGCFALYSNTSGNNNSGFGESALYNNATGANNSAFGYQSLFWNTGSSNVAFGARSLFANRANTRSTAIGIDAMANADSRTSGRETFNTALGYEALRGSDDPTMNTGQYNTAIGDEALKRNSNGMNNTGIGALSISNNSTGFSNSALGKSAMFNNTTGYDNTAVGASALFPNQTGNGNTAIGSLASFTQSGLINTSCLGYFSGGVVNSDNRVEIGNTSVSWIGGQVSWAAYSDGRIKKDIKEEVVGLDFITKLRPVTYHLDIRKQNELCFAGRKDIPEWESMYEIEKIKLSGFVAQEVEDAARNSNYNFSGVHKGQDDLGLYSLKYAEFVVPIVKAVQEQQEIIEKQNQLIDELSEKINMLMQKMEISIND
jgi:trimeric autotransporter adhesin